MEVISLIVLNIAILQFPLNLSDDFAQLLAQVRRLAHLHGAILWQGTSAVPTFQKNRWGLRVSQRYPLYRRKTDMADVRFGSLAAAFKVR